MADSSSSALDFSEEIRDSIFCLSARNQVVNILLSSLDEFSAVNGMEGYEGLTGVLTCNGGECNASGPSFQVVQDGAWVIP